MLSLNKRNGCVRSEICSDILPRKWAVGDHGYKCLFYFIMKLSTNKKYLGTWTHSDSIPARNLGVREIVP